MEEVGMRVEFNGKHYEVLAEDIVRRYELGEMACELSRLGPSEFKEIIIKADHFNEPINRKAIIDALFNMRKEMREKYPLIISEMMFYCLLNASLEYLDSDEEQKKEWMKSVLTIGGESIPEYILKDTGYDSFGDESNGQFLLTLYYYVIYDYCLYKAAFLSFVKADEDPEELERAAKVLALSDEDAEIQRIGYKIIGYDGRFNSVYTIKSFFSLLIFEMAHVIDNDVKIVKCKNCGQYFVPKTRSDTRYCSYPTPDNPGKTCKEIGAQKAWANKEKTDDATREYRKVYMRYNMKVKRHPEDTAVRETLYRLIDEAKVWREKLATGAASTAEFIEWLGQF